MAYYVRNIVDGYFLIKANPSGAFTGHKDFRKATRFPSKEAAQTIIHAIHTTHPYLSNTLKGEPYSSEFRICKIVEKIKK